jgi:hypothetical protein
MTGETHTGTDIGQSSSPKPACDGRILCLQASIRLSRGCWPAIGTRDRDQASMVIGELTVWEVPANPCHFSQGSNEYLITRNSSTAKSAVTARTIHATCGTAL